MTEKRDYIAKYYDNVIDILKRIMDEQRGAVESAAMIVAETVRNDGIVYLFGTGHSHMMAEEPYYRAGGLVPVMAILDEGLMLHAGALKSTLLERLPGYAGTLLRTLMPAKKDCIFVISNSGRNAAPVEMATEAKALGMKVVALTSLGQSKEAESRAPSGKRLFEVADVVLDNLGVTGDASVPIDEKGISVGPTSTISGAFLINSVFAEAASILQEWGIEPPLFTSGNVEGGEMRNFELIQKYRNRVSF